MNKIKVVLPTKENSKILKYFYPIFQLNVIMCIQLRSDGYEYYDS